MKVFNGAVIAKSSRAGLGPCGQSSQQQRGLQSHPAIGTDSQQLLFFGFIAMRAASIREHGGLDALRIEEIPEPTFADDEVVLEVRSAGLNHLDISK